MLSDHTLAAQIVAGNDDLLTQILLRLPIRSLLQFKSVSTHWLSLISNPTFSLLRNYRCPNPNPISGVFLHRSSRLTNTDFDFVPLNNDDPANPPFRTLNFVNNPCGLTILQSCNGLVLCCCTDQCGTAAISNYYIYNPTTNKFNTLPDPNRGVFRYIETVCAVNIAFDPSKSPHYKAVCVYYCETLPAHHFEIEIYSSETGLWTPSGDPFDAEVDFEFPVYWNGSINWISIWGDSLYFNLNTQRLGTIPMSPVPESWDEVRNPFVGESGGHLHLLAIHGFQTTHFNVYEMEIDYSNWFVKYNVDLDSLPSAFPEMIRSSRDPLFSYGFFVMDVIRGDKDEDSFLVLQIPGKTIRYNFVDKTYKKLCDFIPDDASIGFTDVNIAGSLYRWVNSFQFIESLASV